MKKLLSYFSVSGFLTIFSKSGAWCVLIIKKALRKLYFSKFARLRFGIFTQRLLLAVMLRLFFRSLIDHYQISRHFSVTRTHSNYRTWLLEKRGLRKVNPFMGNSWLPSRLRVNENYSPLKRKDATKFRVPLIVYIPFIFVYLSYGQRPYDLPLVGSYFPSPTATMIDIVSPTPTISTLPTGTLAYALPASILTARAVTPIPSLPSNGFPFRFPVILDQGLFYSSVNTVLFSYYFPDLGGVNCHPDNWDGVRCKNVTASHVVGWREYLGKGIAVHPDMLDSLPYGSLVYVSSPSSIAGLYTVVDLCNGCFINGKYYFDFLFPSMPQSLNWSVPVTFGVTRIGWFGAFPTITPTALNIPIIPSATLALPTVTPTVLNIPITATSTLEAPTITPTALNTPVIPSATLEPTPTALSTAVP